MVVNALFCLFFSGFFWTGCQVISIGTDWILFFFSKLWFLKVSAKDHKNKIKSDMSIYMYFPVQPEG